MEGRHPSDSHTVLANRMGFTDANSAGFVHGGTVMKLCDEVAGLAAIKHSSRRVVTAGVDRMTFLDRVLVGEVVTVRATVNAAWRTSMEVGVRVEAEDPFSGQVRHTSSAYLTMVALDDKGVPTEVPELIPTTAEEQRREREAQARRRNRLAEREHAVQARAADAPGRLSPTDHGHPADTGVTRLHDQLRRTVGDGLPPQLVASGAAAAAITEYRRIARDRKPAGRPFRLRAGEPIPDGLRRIAGEQVDMAIERLDGQTREDHPEAVHEARKGLKRLRAAIRLARGDLGDDVYRRENTTFREAGRRLADTRDAQVLVETLDKAVSDDPAAARDLRQLHDALVSQRDGLNRRSASGNSEEVLSELRQARERIDAWPLDEESFAALAPGLERIYRRGRRALKTARADPTDEHMHELRKRVKDLWHASQLLRPAAPKLMKALARDLHALADRLGDDHDLAVLLVWAKRHPEQVGANGTLAALEELVAARRAKLRADALRRADAIYKRKPRAFVKRTRRRWEKRDASQVAA
jgi:acyl-CoA hydrolase/CHAD domain-containing protein